jgi:hypothetical protein
VHLSDTYDRGSTSGVACRATCPGAAAPTLGSAAAFADRCGALAALGLDHVVVLTSGPWTGEAVGRLVAAVPIVAS